MSKNPFSKKVEEIAQEPEPLTFQPEPEKEIPTSPKEVKEEKNVAVVLSEDNAYIHDVLKAQPRSLKDVRVDFVRSEDPNKHRLSLPPEFEKYEKRYTFRWIYKNRRAISEAVQNKGWLLVNRTYFPEVPDYLFTSNGICERGDGILGFIPRKVAEQMRQASIDASREMVGSKIDAHKGNPNFYVPTDKTEEGETSRVVGL